MYVVELLPVESHWPEFGRALCVPSKLSTPSAICLRLFEQEFLRAASRADCTAGSNSATSTPMIAITTNNSTSVNALRPDGAFRGQRDMFFSARLVCEMRDGQI